MTMKKSKPVKDRKKRGPWIWVAAIPGVILLGTITWLGRNEPPTPTGPQREGRTDELTRPAPATGAAGPTRIPPYFESAEAAKPFPKLLPAAYFLRSPLVASAYRLASEIPGVIAQQPCYCYCDKYNHRSLLDCYASDHGAS